MAYLNTAAAALRRAKQAAASANAAAMTTAAAAGANPTKAEFDKVVTDLGVLRTAHNDLLTKLRAAGLLAP
nr:hypothetical protein KPHV_60780 [Kitasatospora purpeofusca]